MIVHNEKKDYMFNGVRVNNIYILIISHLCDNGYKVKFAKDCCITEHNEKKDCMFNVVRVNNIYLLYLKEVSFNNAQCLVTMGEDSWLWHRRLSHINFDLLNKIVAKDLVIGLPKIKFSKDHLCDACQKGKQISFSFKSKNIG